MCIRDRHGLEDDRGGGLHAARRIAQHLLEVRDGVDALAEIAVVGHRGGVLQRHAGGGAQVRVAGDGQRAHGDAVEAVGEVDDVGAAGDLAGELERRFDRVGAGRAGELHDVIAEPARGQDDVVHRLQEALLGDGVEVEAVGDAVLADVVDEGFLEDGIVVPVVEGAGAGQEVEVAASLHVAQLGAAGVGEDGREAAGVGADVGLEFGEDLVVLVGVVAGDARLAVQHG